jgi:hypothetical protein
MDSAELTGLLSLHRHFLAADAVKQFLFTDVPVDQETAAQLGDRLDLAQVWSAIIRLEVFYALLYVVVEGYRDLGYQYGPVDTLLAESGSVDALRKFRNAVFHPQAEPLSPKLTAFLNAKDSEIWTHDLYGALKGFFESRLPIKEFLKHLSADAPGDHPAP